MANPRTKPLGQLFQIEGNLRVEMAARVNPGDVPFVAKAYQSINEILSALDSKTAVVQEDLELSALGRQRRIEQIGAEALASLAKLQDGSEGWNHAAEVLRTETAKKASAGIKRPTDPAELANYERDLESIRNDLRKLDPLERNHVYLEETDPQILDAIETAPKTIVRSDDKRKLPTFIPFVDPELVAQVQTKRAVEANPAAQERLETLGRQVRLYDSLSKSFTKAVNERIPETVYDPVKAQAEKVAKMQARERASVARAAVQA